MPNPETNRLNASRTNHPSIMHARAAHWSAPGLLLAHSSLMRVMSLSPKPRPVAELYSTVHGVHGKPSISPSMMAQAYPSCRILQEASISLIGLPRPCP